MLSVRHSLLTYIGYVLKGRFSYEKCSFDFLQVGIKHELATLRKEFSLLKKEGLIEFKTHYRKPVPVISSKGKLEIKTHLPFRKYDVWDKKWRLVLFDLPQRERNYRLLLVDALCALGFTSISRGAYASPHHLLKPIDRLTNHWGIRQYVQLVLAEKIEGDLIFNKWNLKKIATAYNDFIKKLARVSRHERLWPLQAKQLEQEFVEIFALDPHLPAEFLPKDWPGEQAYTDFKEIANSY